MKFTLIKFALLFIATTCVCGICSKEDANSNNDSNSGGNNTPVQPAPEPDSTTWVTFDNCPTLVYYYPGNNRESSQKWIATKIGNAFSGVNTVNHKRYLTWSFENTGKTRFLSDGLNPGGKESFSLYIQEIADTVNTGAYSLDNCWYYVYVSSGALHDSTRTQAIARSSFTITKMNLFQSIGSTVDRYKMSGNATFNIMYWPTGTGSTSDIHTLQCRFNNVFIDYLK